MANGKKSSGKHYTSKGENSNISRWLKNACRRDYLENCKIERTNNQMKAFLKGKRVMLTIENPNKNETNKKFIRVPAREFWKSNSSSSFNMKASH
jgi:hypothetical protein